MNALCPSLIACVVNCFNCMQYVIQLVQDAINSMRDVGLPIDEKCWRGYVTAALQKGDIRCALRGLHEMTTVDNIDKPSLNDVYVPLLEYLAKHDMPRELVAVVRNMEEREIRVDSATWKKVEKMRRFDIVLEELEK